jgi:hypothetical protein
MAQDFFIDAARSRAEAIEMELAACKADLLVHRQNGSLSEASDAVQRIADLTSQQSNLQALTQGYLQSQQPPAPEQLTDSERFARPWSKMTWQDGLDLAKTSRYVGEKGLSWDDPAVKSGYVEAMRRKSEGR